MKDSTLVAVHVLQGLDDAELKAAIAQAVFSRYSTPLVDEVEDLLVEVRSAIKQTVDNVWTADDPAVILATI